MNKKLITILPYEKVQFEWIKNHWDVHLNGTCIYENKLCEFTNELPFWNEEKDEWEDMFVKIYKLSFTEKVRWKWQQWKFEKMIGYHCSYPLLKPFHYRKPKWFYIKLFNWYYKLKKKKK